jgi:hypothetical protein
VSNVKYLGMIIDDKLKWKCHYENMYKNLIRQSSTFKFIKNYVPYKCKKQLYYAYVYSRINYGVEIYGIADKYLLDKLQRSQSRLLKILYNKDWYTPTNELHKNLNILKVEDIVKFFILKFVKNCENGDIPNIFRGYFVKRKEIHDRNTRNKERYDIPLYKYVNYGQRTLKFVGTKLYNELPTYITHCKNQKLYAKSIRKMLLDAY